MLTRAHAAVAALIASAAGAGTVLVGSPALAASSQELRVTASDDAYTSSDRSELNVGAVDKLVAGRLDRDVKVSDPKFTVATTGTVKDAEPGSAEPGSAEPGSAEPGSAEPGSAEPSHTEPVSATPAPTTSAATSTLTNPAIAGCMTDKLLVPTCGVLWGAAAGGFSKNPRDKALKAWEKISGRTATIFHQYHKGDEVFPTKAEIAMTRDPARPRVLLLNWKVAYGSTWAKVAAGRQDARIDRFAARIKTSYPEKFFLALHHEPENDVLTNPAAGMQAKDFAAMYRHVILRLRAQGVDNAINVLAYMGNEKWMSQSWWKDLYPGDDIVDWIGLDSYVSAEKGAYHYGMFADLLDRRGTTGPGWYDWAVSTHPTKPIMVAEWGVYHRVARAVDKSAGYNSVLPELAKRPAIKAVVYFDCLADDKGDRNISITSTKTGLAAFRTLAANPLFNVTIR